MTELYICYSHWLFEAQTKNSGKRNTAKSCTEYRICLFRMQSKTWLITILFCLHYHKKLYNRWKFLVNFHSLICLCWYLKLYDGLLETWHIIVNDSIVCSQIFVWVAIKFPYGHCFNSNTANDCALSSSVVCTAISQLL